MDLETDKVVLEVPAGALAEDTIDTGDTAWMLTSTLLVLMIAMAALLAVTLGGNEVSESYSEISSSLQWAGSK